MYTASAMRRAFIPIACVALLTGVVGLVSHASAAPSPQSTAFSRWTLDFKPGEIRLYVDPRSQKTYWYFTYQVVNRTGEDRMFAPRFDLLSDDGAIQRSGRDVPSDVVRDIMKVLGNPLIEDQNQIIGQVLQGIEHARDGVAVWPAQNQLATEMTLFVSGLSGETKTVNNPLTKAPVVLAKTLSRGYRTEGNAALRPGAPLELVEETWTWR